MAIGQSEGTAAAGSQSSSLPEWQPAAQHPSPFVQVVIKVPGSQTPTLHESGTVQASPSSQLAEFGSPHEPAPSQMSSVQTFPSDEQAVPKTAAHWSPDSSQTSAHSAPPAHGSPVADRD